MKSPTAHVIWSLSTQVLTAPCHIQFTIRCLLSWRSGNYHLDSVKGDSSQAGVALQMIPTLLSTNSVV